MADSDGHGSRRRSKNAPHARAVPRARIPRSGGGGRVHTRRVASGPHGLLRVARGADGARAGRGRDRDILQFSTRPRAREHSRRLVAREYRRDLEARLALVDTALRRILGDDVLGSPEVVEAERLARLAAEGCTPEGRPLYAGHASLDYPDAPHLALWHSLTLLREFRGDGHIAALVAAENDGCDAIVMHVAAGELRKTFAALSRLVRYGVGRVGGEAPSSRLARRRQRDHRRGTRSAPVGRGPDRSVGVAMLGTSRRRTRPAPAHAGATLVEDDRGCGVLRAPCTRRMSPRPRWRATGRRRARGRPRSAGSARACNSGRH